MAKMIPREPIKTNSRAEEKVFKVIKDKLNDEWVAIHSYKWDRSIKSRESDFILLNKDIGAIVLEVKGGIIEDNDGEWTAEDRNRKIHKIKDPCRQSGDGKTRIFYEIKRELNKNSIYKTFKTFRAVIFPDVLSTNFKTNNDKLREITVFKDHLDDFEARLMKIVKYLEINDVGDRILFREEEFEIIKNYFNCQVKTYYNPKDVYLKLKKNIKQLTDSQVNIINTVHANRHVCVNGGSGTGKTIVAMEKARRDGMNFKDVLILMFNRALKDEYELEFEAYENIKVYTLSKFIEDKLCEVYGYDIKEEDTDKLKKLFLEICKPSMLGVWDTIIVDEAQDIDKEIIERVKEIIHDSLLFFYDAKQDLNKKITIDNFEYLALNTECPLKVNLRNSLLISNLLEKVAGEPIFDNKDDKDYGSDVKLLFVDGSDIKKLEEKLFELASKSKDEYEEECLIITSETLKKSQIVCYKEKGTGYCRKDITTALDKASEKEDECKVYEMRGVIFADCINCIGNITKTVRQVKGLEKASVIFYDEANSINSNLLGYVDNNEEEESDKVKREAQLARNLLYTAVGRAVCDLTIILQYKDDKECEKISNILDLKYHKLEL